MSEKAKTDFFKSKAFETRAIHIGNEIESDYGSVTQPITLANAYYYRDLDIFSLKHYYTRNSNPNRNGFEKAISSLNNAKFALAFSSGMGAISAAFDLFKRGDHILVFDDIYGTTYSYLSKFQNKYGFSFDTVDFTLESSEIEKSIKPNTKWFILEPMSNPLLKVPNLHEVVQLAKKHGIRTFIDNTIINCFNFKPHDVGIDIVMESGTKYLGGHNDFSMGVITFNDESLYTQLYSYQSVYGNIASPFDCYLAQRSLKTLKIRMEVHNKNAERIATFLEKHPLVEKVNYPGLSNSKYYTNVKINGFKGCAGVISFYIKNGKIHETEIFLQNLKIFSFATSFGTVDSLAECPTKISKSGFPEELKQKLGITDNLVRLPVGIEAADDLIEDLTQAFEKIEKSRKILPKF